MTIYGYSDDYSDKEVDNIVQVLFRKYLGKWDYIDVRSVLKDRTGLSIKVGLAIKFARMNIGDLVLPRYKDGYLYFYKWEEKDWTYGLLKISSRGGQAVIKATYLLVALGLKPHDPTLVMAKPKVIAVRSLREDLEELEAVKDKEKILQKLRGRISLINAIYVDEKGKKYSNLLSEFYV